MRPALQLVPRVPFYRDEEISSDVATSMPHLGEYPYQTPPAVVSHFLRRYSEKNGIVLDPFCGSGTVLLEANALGRKAYAADVNPIATRIAQAKIATADISEVALWLQRVNLRRPVSLKGYQEFFEPFFHVETYRELVNIQTAVASDGGRIARFVEWLVLGLLHGDTKAHLSVRMAVDSAEIPDERLIENRRLGVTPAYRAVVPRVLKQAAQIMAASDFSALQKTASASKVVQSDARSLGFIQSGEISLVLTAPPLIGQAGNIQGQWLRLWFAGASVREVAERSFHEERLQGWVEFMNEVILELARVTRRTGRAVLLLPEATDLGRDVVDELIVLVQDVFSRLWDPEGVVVPARAGGGAPTVRALVLQRR